MENKFDKTYQLKTAELIELNDEIFLGKYSWITGLKKINTSYTEQELF